MLEKDLRDFADLKSLHAALRTLPPTAPTPLVLDALVHLFTLDDTDLPVLVTTLKKQKPALLALLARRLEKLTSTRALFIREYLRVAGDAAWPAAIDALATIPRIGRNPAGRKAAQQLAADPAAASACAVLVQSGGRDWVVGTVVTVLVFVEGELGLDALAPIVHQLPPPDRELIEKFAPEGSPLTALIRQQQASQRAGSKGVAWARAIGLEVDRFDLHLQLEAEEGGDFLIAIHDDGDLWVQASLRRHDAALPEYAWPTTRIGLFGSADQLGVGVPEPGNVGPWLRAASKKLGLTWEWDTARFRTSVRGKARNQLLAYFRGS